MWAMRMLLDRGTIQTRNIHQLTTSMPQAYHVAIKRDRRVKVPSFPKIELHHYTANILEIGVMEKVIDGFKVKVYDVE